MALLIALSYVSGILVGPTTLTLESGEPLLTESGETIDIDV